MTTNCEQRCEQKNLFAVDKRDFPSAFSVTNLWAVATELLRFLSSERRRTSFGSNGREWMLSQWQWSTLGQKLSHVLNGADSDAAGDDPLL